MSSLTIAAPSLKARRFGLALLMLAALFLTFDTVVKLLASPEALEGTKALGWAPGIVRPLGVLCLAMLVLLLVPITAPLGALLWTGYLGGAVATHVRVGNPWLSHSLFPVYVASVIWAALWLRDTRVRALTMLPTRRV